MTGNVSKGKNFCFTDNKVKLVNGMMVREEPLSIIVDGDPYSVLMRTPGDEEDLVLGFLYSEGVISSPEEIDFIHYCSQEKEKNSVVAGLKNRKNIRRKKRAYEVRSSCGICGKEVIEDLRKNLKNISSEEIFFFKNLINLDKKIVKKQKIFKLTGGTHAAALFDREGKLILLREDIGRHNALDKVIGHILKNGIDCRDKIIFLSGRTSYEMILKVIRLGAPVVASISGTTSLAVDLSKEFNLTLIGFLRGEKMTVYTHPWRIGRFHEKQEKIRR
ncbi:MAG: formate dehydrogenase accessory sulfurtransferase FdhD [bacterium]|nr:formate dehydrogenase accessory sulfurtransferase FdhD [bacterium]